MSEVSICNLALMRFGANAITSLTQNSKEARLCLQFYSHTRDEVLAAHPWGFAGRRVALGLVADYTPEFDWSYAYQRPGGCLAIRKVCDSNGFKHDFEEEGRFILTNLSIAYLKYTQKIEDPTVFTELFKKALSYRMAAELALPLSKKVTVATGMHGKYDEVLDEAMTADAKANRKEDEEGHTDADDSWLAARN